jgi:two-component system, OmpR family, sensor histidine kinase TctE
MISHRADSVTASQINIKDLVRQAVADAIPAEMDRDISVNLSADGDDVVVSGDPVALREAVRNVVENAVHHGGKSTIDVSVTQNGQYVEIRVADDGPGIPKSLWSEASKRFFRVGDGESGSGLGLAIAAEVARSHGASLDFGFEENGFFSVTIKMPAARQGAA